MSRFQIELRTHNIGAERDSPLGIGFGHNFLVLVEMRDGIRRPVEQLHGFSFDRKSGQQLSFDPLGAGRLGARRIEGDQEQFLGESANHPHFVLFEGTEQDARARWNAGVAAARWISEQSLPYRPLHRNSNSMAYSAARTMGFDLRGQPIDRETGRHFSAPGGSNDPRQEHPGAPRSVFEDSLRPFSGYGDHVKTPRHPSPQEPRLQPGAAHPDPRARAESDAMRARSEAIAGRSAPQFPDALPHIDSKYLLPRESPAVAAAHSRAGWTPADLLALMPFQPIGPDGSPGPAHPAPEHRSNGWLEDALDRPRLRDSAPNADATPGSAPWPSVIPALAPMSPSPMHPYDAMFGAFPFSSRHRPLMPF